MAWRKSIIATSGLAADPVFTVHFMYDSALAAGKTDGDSATERLAARLFDFLRAKYAGRIWRLAEAMARWQAAQVSAIITLTPLFTLLFSDLLSMARPDFFARPMLNLLGYLGAFVVVAGAMYSAIGHRIWGGLRKHETVVSQPRSGE